MDGAEGTEEHVVGDPIGIGGPAGPQIADHRTAERAEQRVVAVRVSPLRARYRGLELAVIHSVGVGTLDRQSGETKVKAP